MLAGTTWAIERASQPESNFLPAGCWADGQQHRSDHFLSQVRCISSSSVQKYLLHMKGLASFTEDRLVQSLLKGKYILRIVSPEELQLMDPDSGQKLQLSTKLLKEANRIVKRDLDRRVYTNTPGCTQTKGLTIATVHIEQPRDLSISGEFSLRKFRMRTADNQRPLFTAVQRGNKCSPILIFEGEGQQHDEGFQEMSEGYLGKIEFSATGLKYRVFSWGLPQSQLSMMPTDAFTETRLLVGLP